MVLWWIFFCRWGDKGARGAGQQIWPFFVTFPPARRKIETDIVGCRRMMGCNSNGKGREGCEKGKWGERKEKGEERGGGEGLNDKGCKGGGKSKPCVTFPSTCWSGYMIVHIPMRWVKGVLSVEGKGRRRGHQKGLAGEMEGEAARALGRGGRFGGHFQQGLVEL